MKHLRMSVALLSPPDREAGSMEKIFFFHEDGDHGYFSNWFPCSFTVDGIVYQNTEQYFMAQKAAVFGDKVIFEKILNNPDPKECKRLGRAVSPFDSAIWDSKRYDIMKAGNRAKFAQNPDLREKLLDTGEAILAEASPFDGVWGIKLSAKEAARREPISWPGLNLLGRLLMELRDEFRSEQNK